MRAPLALIVVGATAGPVAAAALPPPPYAADPQFQAAPQYGGQYGGQYAGQYGPPNAQQTAYRQQPQANDRYSGGVAHPVAAPTPQYYSFGPQAASVAAPVRTLGWSGKVEAVQQAAAQAPQGGWSQVSSRWGAPAPQQPAMPQPQRIGYPAVRTPAFQPPATSQGWRPLYPSASPAAAPPRTIYDAPTASTQPSVPQQPAAPQRQASAQNATGPHFYSLHREYGIEPDPIPIPPRFFGPTADLSAPPPDPVLKRVTDSSGQTHTQVAPTDDQGG